MKFLQVPKTLPWVFLIVLVLLSSTRAAPPVWWSEGNPPVISPAIPQNNHGPANIGQAKHMAKRALDKLKTIDSASANTVSALLVGEGKPIKNWNPPTTQPEKDAQHAPLLIGQLKAIATPFYDTLHSAAPIWLDHETENDFEKGQLQLNGTKDPYAQTNFYPWTAQTTDDNNKGIATIGQLKAVFSLRFERDSDSDNLPDLWEIAWLSNTNTNDQADPDGDGLNNGKEFLLGLNPNATADSDGDGLSDEWEIFLGLNPTVQNSATSDVDGDGIPDRLDANPTNSNIGQLSIIIVNPANGSSN